jgi:hypothetical protein
MLPIAFQYCFPIYVTNELLTKKVSDSMRVMLMEKQDMQHLKLKMLLTKKEINNSSNFFNTFQRKQMAFPA